MGADARVLRAVARTRRPWLTPAVRAFSRCGDNGVGWVVLGCALAAARRDPLPAVAAGVAAWGTLGANYAVKTRVARGRPEGPGVPAALIVAPRSHSFPSSHAAMSAASALALAAAVPAAGPVLAPLALAMAASRLYLAVHWPSDVAAGLALGAATGSVVAAAVHRVGAATA